MSDEQVTTYFLDGDWWWIAGRISAIIAEDDQRRKMADQPEIQWQAAALTGGMMFEGRMESGAPPLLHLTITGASDRIYIQAKETAPFIGFWKPVQADVTALARYARDIRRSAIGETFRDVLNRYYARRMRGESPNLRVMAEEAGVNYGSLRQYKIKYDSERRKTASDE